MERRKRRSPLTQYIDALMDSPEKLHRCSEFYFNLRSFYKRKWGCPLRPPHIQGVEVNLFRLYDTVVSLGGWQKVSLNEKWADVARAVGVAEGVAVAKHAIKVIYMRYLSKYEQNEMVGDVDDADSEMMGSRGRSKGFSSMATADCPVSVTGRQVYNDNLRNRSERREAEYDRLIKSLLCGLPNEVDFAMNVCTLLSHPGPRVLRLASAPRLITLLVAHVAIFPDDDSALYELYKSWQEAAKHDFVSFWSGAGIEDEEVLKLIPHIKTSEVNDEDRNLFCGVETEFEPRNVVSWRVQQVLSIIRNLSFEVINKAVMAASWPLLKLLLVCSNCKWSVLRTAALDALSNIACEIDLLCEESSTSNHLLLKTVSNCLNSNDKLQIIRALEIISGLCNNEQNESFMCEFLDHRIFSKIFTVIAVKDIMMCVYTLESLYQISELGASSCNQISLFPHAVDTLVDLATIEAVSFGPSGLVGMKVVEFHTPNQIMQQTQNSSPAQRAAFVASPQQVSSSQDIRMPTHSPGIRALVPPANSASHFDSKVEQLTSRWIRLHCTQDMGHVVPRGELYANYVEDLRKHYNALSGSMQTFTNILKSILPGVIVRTQSNYATSIFENLRFCRNQGLSTHVGSSIAANPPANALAASHPLVQRMLNNNTNSQASLNGQTSNDVINTQHERQGNVGVVSVPVTTNLRINEVTRVGPANSVPTTSMSPNNQRQPSMHGDVGHETRILRVENTSYVEGGTTSSSGDIKPTTSYYVVKQGSQRKSSNTRRINGVIDEKISDNKMVNGDNKVNGFSNTANVVLTFPEQNSSGSNQNTASSEYGMVVTIAQGASVPQPCVSTNASYDGESESISHPQSPLQKRRRYSVRPTTSTANGEYLCEWNGCGRFFASPSSILHHCTTEHLISEQGIQCHWPRCDSTVRARWSMVTHLQDHHCNEAALKAAAKRRREGLAAPLGPVSPERPCETIHHPGYSRNAAVEAIRRHAFNYMSRDITDDPEGPVTKSIRLTSCLILRNLARYSIDGRRLLRRHERLLSWLSLSRLESSSILSQLLAELDLQPSTDSESLRTSTSSSAVPQITFSSSSLCT